MLERIETYRLYFYVYLYDYIFYENRKAQNYNYFIIFRLIIFIIFLIIFVSLKKVNVLLISRKVLIYLQLRKIFWYITRLCLSYDFHEDLYLYFLR